MENGNNFSHKHFGISVIEFIVVKNICIKYTGVYFWGLCKRY